MYSVEELQQIINREIELRSKELIEKPPFELYIPVKYALEMGGKRLRPVLLLLSYNLFSDEILNALPAALAIEVFHNFTLLHDDIMDKADVRRNQSTVHKNFGENNAILSGDAMAFLSYRFLMESKSERLVDVANLFTLTAIEVCEGQQYDMDFESLMKVTEAEYLEMIRLKTAVLLACSLKTGALLANVNENVASLLYSFGINLGLAFQLQDDLLDTFGDKKMFGKKIGGDILANKKTFLLTKALGMTSKVQLNELTKWLNKKEFNPEEKILAVTKIYNEIGIKELTKRKIEYYFNESSQTLQEIPIDDYKKQQLILIGKQMLNRNH